MVVASVICNPLLLQFPKVLLPANTTWTPAPYIVHLPLRLITYAIHSAVAKQEVSHALAVEPVKIDRATDSAVALSPAVLTQGGRTFTCPKVLSGDAPHGFFPPPHTQQDAEAPGASIGWTRLKSSGDTKVPTRPSLHKPIAPYASQSRPSMSTNPSKSQHCDATAVILQLRAAHSSSFIVVYISIKV